METAQYAGRIRAYQRRHPGSEPLHDAWSGLVWAANEALDRWCREVLVPASRCALRGQVAEPLEPLPRWLRLTIVQHLTVQQGRPLVGEKRLEEGTDICDEPSYRWWANDKLLMSLISFEPVAWLAKIFECHRRVGCWQSGEGPHPIDEVLQEALDALMLLDSEQTLSVEAAASTNADRVLLQYVRDQVVGFAEERKPPANSRKDMVNRRFSEGVRLHYKNEGRGVPSAADLTLLSLLSGFEQDEPRVVSDRWRKRLREYDAEK